MFESSVTAAVGSVIHRAIAVAVDEGLSPDETHELLRAWWKVAPIGGTTAWQTRTKATVRVGLYLRRLRPVGWELLGSEVPLGDATADLVYGRRTDGELTEVFIDEVKSGRDPLAADDLPDQVARLDAGGHRHWPGVFRGVRVATVARWSESRFWTSDGNTLSPAEGPELECGEGPR